MILLHAFIKKTQKTPAGDLEQALKQMKEIT
jgi:phage-related protein